MVSATHSLPLKRDERKYYNYPCAIWSAQGSCMKIFTQSSVLLFFSESRLCICISVPACAVRPSQCSPGLQTTIQHQALISIGVAVITAISVAVCVCLGYLCTTTLSPPGDPWAQQLLFASMCSCLHVNCVCVCV